MLARINIPQLLNIPAVCVLCKHYHSSRDSLCTQCMQQLKPLPCGCLRCALPLPLDQAGLCGQCIQKYPAIDQVICAYEYQHPLRFLIHAFKYRQALNLTHLMAQLMMHAQSSITHAPQCLVPMPLHPKKIRMRGFNQSQVLARSLGKMMNVPVRTRMCSKVKVTAPQAQLSAEERQKNVLGAFKVKSNSPAHITLIDDLLTTGNTANELAKTFKAAGVERVDLWCIARTV